MREEESPEVFGMPNVDPHTRACLNLWATVMREAIRSAKNGRRDAVSWLESDTERVGGFRWLCSVFDYDPEFLRKAIASAQISHDQSQCEDAAFSD